MLQKGDKGEAVYNFQTLLKGLGVRSRRVEKPIHRRA
jgi:hypothetical protein